METILIVLVGAIVAILLVGVAILFYDEDRKQRDLTERSALGIARPLSPTGARSGVQQRIQPRASSVSSITVKPLPSVEAARFSGEWRRVQQRFTDDPQAAIADADRLAQDVMEARGYHMAGLQTQLTPASHPEIQSSSTITAPSAVSPRRTSAAKPGGLSYGRRSCTTVRCL